MKNIFVSCLVLVFICRCKNYNDLKNINQKSVPQKNGSIISLSNKNVIASSIKDIDENMIKDSVLILKKNEDSILVLKIVMNNNFKIETEKLLFPVNVSNNAIKNSLFLNVNKNNITISEDIGVNDKLEYHLYYDKNKKELRIKNILYYFVSLHEDNKEDTLVRNKSVDSFNINCYYPPQGNKTI